MLRYDRASNASSELSVAAWQEGGRDELRKEGQGEQTGWNTGSNLKMPPTVQVLFMRRRATRRATPKNGTSYHNQKAGEGGGEHVVAR